MSERYDVVVIGSGPAGLAAAAATAEVGLSTLVIDEFPTAGGRLLGQLHEEPHGRSLRWWKGAEVAREMIAAATDAGAEIRCGTDVWGIFPVDEGGWSVCLARDRVGRVLAERLVIATGAGERGLPLPGWELPGVMTVGGAQVMANVHRVRPGRRTLVVGIDPLSLTIARELAMAGTEVVGVVHPGPLETLGRRPAPRAIARALLALSHLAPAAWIRTVGPLLRTDPLPEIVARLYPKRGIPVWGFPVMLRGACLEILGSDRVEGAVIADLRVDGSVVVGSERRVEVDSVAVSGGLYPMIELAATVGCAVAHIDELGGHVPIHGPDFATTAAGVFVAGNVTGIEGATVAAAQGRAAGVAVAVAAGRIDRAADRDPLRHAIEGVERARESAPFRFLPDIQIGRRRVNDAWAARHG